MSPDIAILLSGLLQALMRMLDRNLSKDDREAAAKQAGEQFAALLGNKDSEVV